MAKTQRGRPKGSRNKVTNEAKAAILAAFEKLGGVERLVEWVEQDPANETLYWTKSSPSCCPASRSRRRRRPRSCRRSSAR